MTQTSIFDNIFSSLQEAPILAKKAQKEATVKFESSLEENGGSPEDWKLLEILKRENGGI